MPEPHGKVADPKRLRDDMVESLRKWILDGKPKDEDKLPRSPKGDIIRKVRVETKDKVAVELNGGTVDRGDMARVDVFRKKNKKGKQEFYIVPIYPHQIATMEEPPDRAINAFKPEEQWTTIDANFEFAFALSAMSYVEIVKPDGEALEGYFRGAHRGTGNVNISQHNSNEKIIEGLGPRRLNSFRKFTIDRLGRKFEVQREVRTWRGKACT